MASNTQIDHQIGKLQTERADNILKKNSNESCYDTLFFTYEVGYKKRVHFAFLADRSGYESYSVLCRDNDWLSNHDDDGYPLDISELFGKKAIFMDWAEAVKSICPRCLKYHSLNKVLLNNAKALRLKGEDIITSALVKQAKLNKQASWLEKYTHGGNQ